MTSKAGLSYIMTETAFSYPDIPVGTIALVGGFGSGKTEVAVNLTRHLAQQETTPTAIVDLDLVNPYFRSREAMKEMEALGVHVIVPRGGQFYADLPILLPEIRGAIESRVGRLVLDVGGDAQGARALGSLADALAAGPYEMLMVLNSFRPFTSDVAGSMETMRRIETTTQLKFTGLVVNSHMLEETTPEIVLDGYRLGQAVSRESGLPVVFLSAKADVLDKLKPSDIACPVLPLSRSMLKPWERKK